MGESSQSDANQEGLHNRKPRFSFREVVNEVLTKVSIGADGLRSRVPRPEALERFKAKNAIANSILRQYFLRRNSEPDNDDSHFNMSDC
ncbi:hypothetical protein KIN20_011084 [Parelaphostrongylus tenuis]|uniref:Uncharacterized protein n=1 Tax=Parelaphostrongylus tenuis TaxID=148309 RepID=A0AAD5QPK8_PARTN|nr:hypothetical protein KIN20_011084 [Parelaphostrongylus tenuis]